MITPTNTSFTSLHSANFTHSSLLVSKNYHRLGPCCCTCPLMGIRLTPDILMTVSDYFENSATCPEKMRCIKASFYIHENSLNFLMTKGFGRKISMKLFYQYIANFFYFSSTSGHLYPLQVENCDSNSRLVMDEDDNGKFRLERVKSNK